MDVFDKYPLEIGIFIVVLAKIIILIQLITTYSSQAKSDKFLTATSFIKNYLFLILMLVHGFFLTFKNI